MIENDWKTLNGDCDNNSIGLSCGKNAFCSSLTQ